MSGRCLRLSGASAVDYLSLRAASARKNYKSYLNDVCRQILSLCEKLMDVFEHKYELLVFLFLFLYKLFSSQYNDEEVDLQLNFFRVFNFDDFWHVRL